MLKLKYLRSCMAAITFVATAGSYVQAAQGKERGKAAWRTFKEGVQGMVYDAELQGVGLDKHDAKAVQNLMNALAQRNLELVREAEAQIKTDAEARMAFFKKMLSRTCGFDASQSAVVAIVPAEGAKPIKTTVYVKPPQCQVMGLQTMRETPAGFDCWIAAQKHCLSAAQSTVSGDVDVACEARTFAICALKAVEPMKKQIRAQESVAQDKNGSAKKRT